MMKIKSLLIAMLAICLTMGFTSCKDDKDDPIENNYTIYQKAVTQTGRRATRSSCWLPSVRPGSRPTTHLMPL